MSRCVRSRDKKCDSWSRIYPSGALKTELGSFISKRHCKGKAAAFQTNDGGSTEGGGGECTDISLPQLLPLQMSRLRVKPDVSGLGARITHLDPFA